MAKFQGVLGLHVLTGVVGKCANGLQGAFLAPPPLEIVSPEVAWRCLLRSGRVGAVVMEGAVVGVVVMGGAGEVELGGAGGVLPQVVGSRRHSGRRLPLLSPEQLPIHWKGRSD